MNICLIKTSSMGDIIHTLPALTDAKNAIPNLRVDWVVEENFTEIPLWHSLQNAGIVNQVIPIALRRWRKKIFSVNTKNEWKNYRTLIQQQQYDVIIDAQGLIKSALFATRLAQGKKYGYDRHCAREPLASCFYQKKFYIDYQQHAVERIRQLFASSLNYIKPNTAADYGILNQFQQANIEQPPYIMFIHATTREDKHWQNTKWKELAQNITALGFHIKLPWGNEQEKQQANLIAEKIENTHVLNKLTLTQLAYEIANAQAIISVDTGLAHLAAALDKTNITLYGATDPQLIGTYGKNQIHLKKEKMELISVNEVFNLLKEIL
ncbi:heptosyltransferase-1 [Bisgaardia hudsonensis]|uniref:Lipopolysaccharide heptosyltransferase 1 n=1 Tax=Bisgaardia hudsonensis TaxID=109472 RepID=A0A4R2MYK5_9PAST|nr:lipopolysaccharide heptosyltransferase RfaC [Bisgaardia hudsonensis]QLB13867.1 lipopolysaccharide heptosyltransferase 1 [Bisgaardia hudsonensis]TCP11648.1 heptosyltransferase-1 [Bisgaardia hudsonensis]